MLVKVDSFMRPQANVTCCARDLQYFFFNALTASCKSLIVCYIAIKNLFFCNCLETQMYPVT